MAVAFALAGTGTSTSSVTWPAGHATGDLGILFVETASGTITTPSGFNLLTHVVASGSATTCAIFWRIATSSSEGAVTIAGGSDHTWATILTFTGTDTTTPIPAYAGMTTVVPSTTNYAPGVKAPVANTMIVQGIAWANDVAGPVIVSMTNAALGSVTERYDAGTTTLNGGGLGIYTGTLATADYSGLGFLDSTGTSLGGALFTLVIQPPAAAAASGMSKSRVVNA